MNLYELIAANTAALIANTAALTGKAAPAADTAAETKAAAKPGPKPKTTPAAPKGPSRDDMVALLTKVKEQFGSDEAKEIVSSVGGVAKMAQIPDAKFAEVCAAAEARLEAEAAAEPEDDGL